MILVQMEHFKFKSLTRKKSTIIKTTTRRNNSLHTQTLLRKFKRIVEDADPHKTVEQENRQLSKELHKLRKTHDELSLNMTRKVSMTGFFSKQINTMSHIINGSSKEINRMDERLNNLKQEYKEAQTKINEAKMLNDCYLKIKEKLLKQNVKINGRSNSLVESLSRSQFYSKKQEKQSFKIRKTFMDFKKEKSALIKRVQLQSKQNLLYVSHHETALNIHNEMEEDRDYRNKKRSEIQAIAASDFSDAYNVVLRNTMLALKLQQAILRTAIKKEQQRNMRNVINYDKISKLEVSRVNPMNLAFHFFSIEPTYDQVLSLIYQKENISIQLEKRNYELNEKYEKMINESEKFINMEDIIFKDLPILGIRQSIKERIESDQIKVQKLQEQICHLYRLIELNFPAFINETEPSKQLIGLCQFIRQLIR